MEVIPYSREYFRPLVAFLRDNWAPGHVIYDEQMFNWQYGGPGGDTSGCRLLVEADNTVRGFLGTIRYPFLYENDVKTAAGLAIWVVGKEIQNSGAGLFLRKAVEDTNDIVYTIGINRSIIGYYQKRGYSCFDSLYRYVAPLNTEGYLKFLPQLYTAENDVAGGPDAVRMRRDAEEWIASMPAAASDVSSAGSVEAVDAAELEKAYRVGVAPYFTLRPQKDALFWQWRYCDSKGFKYHFYRDSGGIIIFREESVHAPQDADRHGQCCLRIIEIIPSHGGVWNGEPDDELAEALGFVLMRAKRRGCVLADFQISSSRLGHILGQAGFRLQQDTGITNIARLFSPYRADAQPLNFVYRAHPGREPRNIDRDYVYLVKSDTDMDRPNYLK